MHRRNTRRQANSMNRGQQQKRVVGDTRRAACRKVKEKQCPHECVRADGRRQKVQHSSVPDACIAILCNCERTACTENVRHPGSIHPPDRTQRPPAKAKQKIVRGEGRERYSYLNGQRNSREQRTPSTQRNTEGQSTRTIAWAEM